eukprot:g43729.t1
MVEEKTGQVAKKGTKKVVKWAPAKNSKKNRKSRLESYTICIYKLTRQAHPNTGNSSKDVSIMNSFINNIFKYIMGEASCLAHYNQRRTAHLTKVLLYSETTFYAVCYTTNFDVMCILTKYTSYVHIQI